MFEKEDTTFRDIQERSYFQWLEELEQHDDLAVRGGVKLAREYVEQLKMQNKKLREENELKNEYLKKVKLKKQA